MRQIFLAALAAFENQIGALKKRGVVVRRVLALTAPYLVLALACLPLAGCKGAAVPGLTTPDFALSTSAFPGPGDVYTLDSGDQIRFIVFGQQNLSNVYSVSGAVAMPLIGPVRARGLTTFELSSQIARKLARKYVKDPKVTVEVATYRLFFILGEVNRPGQYPYVSAMTVEAAAAIASTSTTPKLSPPTAEPT